MSSDRFGKEFDREEDVSRSQTSRGSYLALSGEHSFGHSGDVEINLAPVIDCLTVLIVYTIISASFLSLGVFQTTVPSESSSQAQLAEVQVRVDINTNHTIDMSISGTEKKSETLAAHGDDWDFSALANRLESLKNRSHSLNTMTLAAQTGVTYRDVVRAVEQSKRVLPNIVLGE